MIIYWALLLVPMYFALCEGERKWNNVQSVSIIAVLSVIIGLRYEVGGDWEGYLPYLTRAENLDLYETFKWGDPGYNTLNWIFARFDWGIYGVNTVCAIIFSCGLVFFCRQQENPWLSLCVAIPYLVIVVAMGYSRQGVAIGFILIGLQWLAKGNLFGFLCTIAGAASFHSTALVMLAFVVPAIRGKSILLRVIRLGVLAASASGFYLLFLESAMDRLIGGYIENEYTSEGATIRVAMNIVPCLVVLMNSSKLRLQGTELLIWKGLGWTGVACALALILFPSNSTAVDRVALYVLPIQIAVLPRMATTSMFGLRAKSIKIALCSYLVLVEFTWLFFATHAYGWLPYKNLIWL